MGQVFSELNESQQKFIAAQSLFFVASAPLSGDGHVNLSPKGLDSFRVLGPKDVAWLDLVGSGAETIAHLRENGRLTILFCAFSGAPKILRLYGRGEVHRPGGPRFDELAEQLPKHPGCRSIIRCEIQRVSESCGYGIPKMELVAERRQLHDWCDRKGAEGIQDYIASKNRVSIDGLPAVEAG